MAFVRVSVLDCDNANQWPHPEYDVVISAKLT